MTPYEQLRNAIARRDPSALRRMAQDALDEQTRVSLALLADILEQQNKGSSLRARRTGRQTSQRRSRFP